MNTKVVRLANRNYNLPEDIVFLLNDLDAKDEKIEQLRAALEKIAQYTIKEGCQCGACEHSAIARATLEGEQ